MTDDSLPSTPSPAAPLVALSDAAGGTAAPAASGDSVLTPAVLRVIEWHRVRTTPQTP